MLNYAAHCTPIELELRLRLTGSFDAYNRGHMQALREAVDIEKAIDNGNTALASASYEL